MISLKSILLEAKLYSYTTAELLDKLLVFKGKTIIFFDTEAAGLEPNVSYIQLTQLAAMAFDGNTMELIGEFTEKAKIGYALDSVLNKPDSIYSKNVEKLRQKYLKRYKDKKPETGLADYPSDEVILKKAGFMHPREVLDMTKYYSSPSTLTEAEVLTSFVTFLKKYKNVVLIAHNATFDMKVLQARLKKNRLPPLQRYPVIDTVKISRFFFIPILQAIESSDAQAKDFLKQLLAKTKFVSYASNLEKLASVFDIKSGGWHDAMEDIKMLFQLLNKFIEFLETHKNIDISKFQGAQAKRLRHMK